DHAHVAGLAGAVAEARGRLAWRLRGHQADAAAVQEHGVAHAEHGHAHHRTPVHVDATRALGHRQPHAAAVDAEIHQRGIVDRPQAHAAAVTADAVHPDGHRIVVATGFETQLQGVLVPGNL